MKIGEIARGSVVFIRLKVNEQLLDFQTIAESGCHTTLILNPVLYQGKLLKFDNQMLKFELSFVNSNEEKLYMFNNVTLRMVKDKKEKYHLVAACYQLAIPFNRRKDYRVFVGDEGIVQLGDKFSSSFTVKIRDISNSGISFLGSNTLPANLGSSIRIFYQDSGNFTKVNLRAHIVRKMETDNRTTFGCQLENPASGLSRYISAKQRSLMAVNSKWKLEK